jgi:hypothetical protein
VVECGGLENRYVGNPGVGGSNPPLSAPLGFRSQATGFSKNLRLMPDTCNLMPSISERRIMLQMIWLRFWVEI